MSDYNKDIIEIKGASWYNLNFIKPFISGLTLYDNITRTTKLGRIKSYYKKYNSFLIEIMSEISKDVFINKCVSIRVIKHVDDKFSIFAYLSNLS